MALCVIAGPTGGCGDISVCCDRGGEDDESEEAVSGETTKRGGGAVVDEGHAAVALSTV